MTTIIRFAKEDNARGILEFHFLTVDETVAEGLLKLWFENKPELARCALLASKICDYRNSL